MVKQISVYLENKKGTVAECCRILKEADININSMFVADTTDFGILRITTSDNDRALKLLKENKYVSSIVDLVCIEVPDKPGALADMLGALDDAGVNIEYLYSYSNTAGRAQILFKTGESEKAIDILKKTGGIIS